MSIRHKHKNESGFQIHTWANEALSLSIAPELGGRIVSLRDRISRREWLDGWSPASKRRIWHPTDPANFETGPGAGIVKKSVFLKWAFAGHGSLGVPLREKTATRGVQWPGSGWVWNGVF